jgi:hypothetical protein
MAGAVHYEHVRTQERYCSFICLALSIGGKLLIAGSPLNPYEKVFGNTLVEKGVGVIPDRVKGYAARLTDELVSFYPVAVGRRVECRREPSEAIRGVKIASRARVWEMIRSGELRDGFTLQGIALFEKLGGGQ